MQKTPLKKQRKSSRATLIRKLDVLVSKIVRERDKACVLCSDTFMLQCGHLFSRVNYSTRWDLENCHAQCAACNMRHEYAPYPYYRWFIGKFGQDKLDELNVKHHQVKKWKDWELQELYDELNKLTE